MKELVTVVVPVYNVEKYLDRCLQSIAEQTYSNLEIILVDDGSRDTSGAICDRWARKDARIKVVHKENAGLGMARNTGLEQAHGKYVFFFDSDDYVDHRVVEKCVHNAKAHGSCVVMFGRHDVYDDTVIRNGKVTAAKLLYEGNEIRELLLPQLLTYELGFGVSAWGKMFCVDFLRKFNLRFPSEREIISEDAFFTLEFCAKADIATILPECLYYYCKRSDSLTRSFRRDRQLRNDEFLIQCEAYVERNQLPPQIVHHLQSRYHGLTLGTMMQLIRSELPFPKKRQELYKIYRSGCLCRTLDDAVLGLDSKKPRVFWKCLKYKQYWLCTRLLYANTYTQR